MTDIISKQIALIQSKYFIC